MDDIMEQLVESIFYLKFEDLKSFNFPRNIPFGLIIYINDIKYEFLLNLEDNIDKLLILCSAALPKDSNHDRSRPVFHRWSWNFGTSIICYNDPTMYINDQLLCGWGVGTPNDWYLENISKILLEISSTLNIPRNHMIFYGSSSGGFMSVMLSTLIKDSYAIADIPQLILNANDDSYRWLWYEIKSFCFEGLSDEVIREKFNHRINFIELIKREQYIPNIFLIADCSVDYDFKMHYLPFFNQLNKLPFKSKDSIYILINYKNRGHFPYFKDEFLNIYLKKIFFIIDVQNNESNKYNFNKSIINYSLQDKGVNLDYNNIWNSQFVNLIRSNEGTIIKKGKLNWFGFMYNNNEFILPKKFKMDIDIVKTPSSLHILLLNIHRDTVMKTVTELNIPSSGGHLSIIYDNGCISWEGNKKIKEKFDLGNNLGIRFDLWGSEEEFIFKNFSITNL